MCEPASHGDQQYYTATTIDGYIADEHNSLSWLFEVPAGDDEVGHEVRFAAFMADVGAIVMGSTTFEWVIEHEQLLEHPEKWRAFYGDTPTWVFTHRDLPSFEGADIRFVQGDVRPIHAAMVERPATRTSGSSAVGNSWGSSPMRACSTRSS